MLGLCLAACVSKAERCGFGRVLAGCCLGVWALCVGVGETTPVGNEQRAEGEERGVRAASSLSFHVARLGSGQTGLGSTAGVSTSMATGSRRTGTVKLTVNSIYLDFCPPGARHNARKKFKFEFLKIATVVRQHIGQGFQGYFCLEKISCFAEITFEF
jgi:hypothetical protein